VGSPDETLSSKRYFDEGEDLPAGYNFQRLRQRGRLVSGDFRVGAWLVTPGQNSISCRGTTVRLEPKVMEVLLCLARQAGETLSKETLLRTVWPGIVVTDDVLTRCVAELRRAFEDDAREPRIIQTIPKRGYRLLATVSKAGAVPTPDASAVRDSIVVLPFVNMSADAENEYFADGITEEIINALAQIKELHVVARTSAFSFKGRHIDARIVGEQLNVRTVLEGSVRRAGNQLRITVQLVKAADGYHLWSERYDREMKDVFAIQDEIARAIARRLQVTFEESEQEPLVKAKTQNLEAYQLYLKGRTLLYRRGSAILRSVECCQRAVELDPEYALAWAGLADCYTTLGYYGLARPDISMPKAREAAQRAVALDPSLAEGHNALAMASLMGAWDRAEAEREFLRAIELNPRYVQAHDWYGLFYLQWSDGRLAEGRAQAKLALESDPLSSYANAIYGLTCANAGKHAEALRVSRYAVELDPENYIACLILHFALYANGLFEESVATAELALAMSGRHSWAMAFLAVTLADWGKTKDAEAVYGEMSARACRQYVAPAALAVAASGAGREDDAVRHTLEAFEIRDPQSQILFTRYFSMSARLYAYPGFRTAIAHHGRGDWVAG
jgi:adenylate cyclase